MIPDNKAIFTIGTAAKMLEVHPRTLRIYERENLVKPLRKGQWRYYTMDDIKWIQCLRDMIHERYGDKLKAVNDGIEKNGAFYLFTLRLVPVAHILDSLSRLIPTASQSDSGNHGPMARARPDARHGCRYRLCSWSIRISPDRAAISRARPRPHRLGSSSPA